MSVKDKLQLFIFESVQRHLSQPRH